MGSKKHKTRKAAAKRLRLTRSGKIKHFGTGRSHLQTGKSRKRKRRLRRGALISPADYNRVKNMLPR